MHTAVELLKKIIAIPSFSREEDRLADLLEKYIEENGCIASRKGNNVWALSPAFDVSLPTLLLNSHIDTVKPAASWSRNPFEPVLADDKLYGLGSNDAGASIVSLLEAFFYLTQKKQFYNLIFAASAEKEISGENGMESLLKELPKIDFAIVGEPTKMNAAIAETGLMPIDCSVSDESGCAVRYTSSNSIASSIEHSVLVQLKKMKREFFGSPILSDQALMPFPSIKIGPGESSKSQMADEFINIHEIESAIKLYIELLDELKI